MYQDITQVKILKGRALQLEPLVSSHREGLLVAAAHEAIWLYMPYKATGHFFAPWFADTIEKMSLGTQITYVVRRISDQQILGATAYYDLHKEHQRLALGYSWYRPEVWGTGINLECKLLMLSQAFEDWGVNRVEIGADPRNTRSIGAIKKLGATEEGILRDHMISSEGHLTNTVVFSILAAEWSEIKNKITRTY